MEEIECNCKKCGRQLNPLDIKFATIGIYGGFVCAICTFKEAVKDPTPEQIADHLRKKEMELKEREEAAMMKEDEVMPFGKHQGKKLANVPASYLVWFYESSVIRRLDGDGRRVWKYCEANINDLRKEAATNAR